MVESSVAEAIIENGNVSIWEEAYSIQEKLLLNDQLDFGIFNETREHLKLELNC